MLFTTPEQFIVLAILLIGGWLLGYASAPGTRKWKRRVQEQSDSFSAYYSDLEDKFRAANHRADELKVQLAAARSDHAEAERTIAGLRAAAVVPAPAPIPAPPVAIETVPEPLAPPETMEKVVAAAPKEAPAAPGDTFPVAADAAAPREDAAPLPADPAPAAETVIALPGPVPVESAPIGPAEPEMPSKGWFASSARDDLTRIRGIDSVLNTRLFGLGVTRFEDIEKLSAEDEMALEHRLNLPVGYVGREQWRTQAALLRAGKDEEHAAHFGLETPVA